MPVTDSLAKRLREQHISLGPSKGCGLCDMLYIEMISLTDFRASKFRWKAWLLLTLNFPDLLH